MLLLITAGHTTCHALVAADGRVWDNHMPHGEPGDSHPFARCSAQCYMVEKVIQAVEEAQG